MDVFCHLKLHRHWHKGSWQLEEGRAGRGRGGGGTLKHMHAIIVKLHDVCALQYIIYSPAEPLLEVCC